MTVGWGPVYPSSAVPAAEEWWIFCLPWLLVVGVGAAATDTGTDTVWLSITALTSAVPALVGVRLVECTPFTREPVAGRILPETPVNDQITKTPSGIKIPPADVSVPADVLVIVTRTALFCGIVTDDGDAETLITSQGSYVTGPFTRFEKSGLFVPHQVSVTVTGNVALIALPPLLLFTSRENRMELEPLECAKTAPPRAAEQLAIVDEVTETLVPETPVPDTWIAPPSPFVEQSVIDDEITVTRPPALIPPPLTDAEQFLMLDEPVIVTSPPVPIAPPDCAEQPDIADDSSITPPPPAVTAPPLYAEQLEISEDLKIAQYAA